MEDPAKITTEENSHDHEAPSASREKDAAFLEPQAIGLSNASSSDSTWRAVRLLGNKTWLSNTLKLSTVFAPQCTLAAIVLSLAGVALFIGYFCALGVLKTQGNTVQLANLLTAAGILLATMFVYLGFFVWGLALWLMKLSTYSHTFCNINMMTAPFFSKEQLKEKFDASLKEVRTRKSYFASFYLLVTLVVIVPLLFAAGIGFLLYLGSTPESYQGLRLALPPVLAMSLEGVIAVLAVYFLSLSPLMVIISSCSRATASVAAWDCLKFPFRQALPLTVITIAVVVMNLVIATPEIFFQPQTTAIVIQENFAGRLCALVWEGVTSVFLFTLSMAPFCELMRYRLK